MSEIDIKRNVAMNITKFRKSIGISQKELANRLNVVPSRVSNWETGTNMMDIDTLFKICDVLNISINDIYGIYPESNMRLTYDEQEHIKKYRVLDNAGKNHLSIILSWEIERIENSLSTNNDESLSDLWEDCPATPEELEAMYPPIKKGNKKTG